MTVDSFRDDGLALLLANAYVTYTHDSAARAGIDAHRERREGREQNQKEERVRPPARPTEFLYGGVGE